jgi:hypothetical protein
MMAVLPIRDNSDEYLRLDELTSERGGHVLANQERYR